MMVSLLVENGFDLFPRMNAALGLPHTTTPQIDCQCINGIISVKCLEPATRYKNASDFVTITQRMRSMHDGFLVCLSIWVR